MEAPFILTLLPGAVGGLQVIFEKESRRIELALYVLQQALPCTYRCAIDAGYVRPIANGTVVLFQIATMIALYSYCVEPNSMRSSYLSAFDFFFERKKRNHAKVQHDKQDKNADDLARQSSK